MDVRPARLLRFGAFELDVRAGELRKHGVRIRLQDQSFQILLMLLDRPGEVILRDEIRQKLWPNNTIVEFDHSINAAIKRLRFALGESAEDPRYIETLVKRGYRFCGEVENVAEAQAAVESNSGQAHAAASMLDTGDLLGQTISHYRILSRLGSGGMGVVYRAEDLTLARHVALKVLLPYPMDDLPESTIRRFEREARAASALNHPNICTIYGFEKLGGRPAILMELVDGETLEQRLCKGPLPLDQSLDLAVQIAGALAEAHRKGVVHRDLKPGNIMLTKARAKVLDFGLAKEYRLGASRQHMNTTEGAIQGTLHYMSPEQARGEEVDARSDIFSFGVVMYETLTGRRPFDGDTSARVINAIVEHDPPPLAPLALDRLIRRCLAKDRDQRWQSTLDMKAELEWLAETPPPYRPDMRSAVRTPWGVRSRWIAAGSLAAVMSLLSAIFLHEKQTEPSLVRFNISPPEGTVFGGHPAPAVSPDGRRIVFVTTWKENYRLWLRSLDETLAVPLAGPDGDVIADSPPFWSPDGKSIAFFADDKLKRIDLDRPSGPSEPVTLCDARDSAGGTWNQDGVILYSTNGGLLYRVADTGGPPIPITRLDEPRQERAHLYPWFLPDGRHFLFAAGVPSFPSYHFTIRLGALDSQETKVVLNADSNAIFAQDRILYVRGEKLMAQPFDSRKLMATGDPVSVADRIAVLGGWSSFSASQNGLLVYHAGAQAPPYDLIWFDRNGNRMSTLGKAGAPNNPDYPQYPPQFSPDQRALAVAASEQDSSSIWLYDVARGLRTRFTFEPAQPIAPVWSPDGRTIVFASRRTSHYDLFRKAADRSRAEELLYADAVDKFPTSWSPDGKFLLYDGSDGKTKQRSSAWVLPLKANPSGGPLKPFPLAQSPVGEARGQFSPDGKWVAYESEESGQSEIYLAPFRSEAGSSGGRRQISPRGGSMVRWRKDGKEIFYRRGIGRSLVAAAVNFTGNTIDIGAEKQIVGSLSILGYDVTSDGQRFLLRLRSREAASQPLTVVQNWTAALKK